MRSKKDLPNFIRNSYGEEEYRIFRRYESTSKKLEKAKLDLEFLIKCKIYDVIPKFLRFKLYKRSLHYTSFYKSWQANLLRREINAKKKCISNLTGTKSQLRDSLRQKVGLVTHAAVSRMVKSSARQYRLNTSDIHERKLRKLGINNAVQPCDPNLVVHNYSNTVLSFRVKTLLAFGLFFNLPVYKINFYQYFLSFEKLAYSFKKRYNDSPNLSEFFEQLQNVSFKYFYGFKPFKVFSSFFTKSDLAELKSLSQNKDIIVTKPDKGRAVVILDRNTYVTKMQDIVSDSTKFQPISESLEKYSLKIEDKVNNFLRKMKNLNIFSDDLYKQLFVSGSGPGILYGLPKIHKPNFRTHFQFRPIFAAYNSAVYGIAKFLVPILGPLTTNSYTVENSYSFAKCIVNFKNANSLHMTSFDVENLFTNVPVNETISIIIDKLFIDASSTVLGMDKTIFKKFLELCVLNTFFLFNNKIYKQIEGLGMGLPLGPTFANIFMCHNEEKWLNECPSDFRPVFYKRYIDDTFVLFRDQSHSSLFLDYLNSRHANIKFTKDEETHNKLNFLDVTVERSDNSFITNVYRKPTFTGLGISFFSFCTKQFKINSVKTLIHRAYNICSTYNYLHTEFKFLENFFFKNGFPTKVIQTYICKFLSKMYNPVATVPQSDSSFYITLPYFGQQSEKLKVDLTKLIDKYFNNMSVKIILVNKFNINSFFRFKDTLPLGMRSSLVYSYKCAQCASQYVGSTHRTLRMRVAEHAGRSYRTNRILASPPHSSIRAHCVDSCEQPITLGNFNILDTKSNSFDLRILESLYIHRLRPELNDMQSSYPLKIVIK